VTGGLANNSATVIVTASFANTGARMALKARRIAQRWCGQQWDGEKMCRPEVSMVNTPSDDTVRDVNTEGSWPSKVNFCNERPHVEC
jgi:hypothetical protein